MIQKSSKLQYDQNIQNLFKEATRKLNRAESFLNEAANTQKKTKQVLENVKKRTENMREVEHIHPIILSSL